MHAMRSVEDPFSRNALEPKEQALLRDARIVLIGLGGTGGFILENLVRMGAGDITLFEDDIIEASNLNRQILSSRQSLGMEKAEEALRRAKSINPDIRIRAKGPFPDHSMPDDASIVFDATDNLPARLEAHRAASALHIPYVFCSAQGWRGMVSVFEGYCLRKALAIDQRKMDANPRGKARRVVCPAAAIAGSLASAMGANRLMGKPFPSAPDALFFDLRGQIPFWRANLG